LRSGTAGVVLGLGRGSSLYEVLVELPDDDMGTIPMHNVVPRLSKTPGTFQRPAPKLGEHTDKILGDLGLDTELRAKLRAEGVI